ncbi:MAG: UDP-N-acetylglucosamine 2-epimerase [Euryarchaeota archaeon]|nr:UDP-N-acetylglucosamine 2-epimerase [Euryarchaeota archaeon]
MFMLHKSLNSGDIIRPGTRITRIKRIYTDMCVLTLRDNIGRPETVEAGSNVLAGTEAMIRCARGMLERGNRWKDQFGDGRAGEGIIEILTRYSKRLI